MEILKLKEKRTLFYANADSTIQNVKKEFLNKMQRYITTIKSSEGTVSTLKVIGTMPQQQKTSVSLIHLTIQSSQDTTEKFLKKKTPQSLPEEQWQ